MRSVWVIPLFLFVACGEDFVGVEEVEEEELVNEVTGSPSIPLTELNAAPEEIQLGSQTLLASAELWRDFEPGRGMSLQALFAVTAEDETPLPSGLRISRIWAIKGLVVWETTRLTDMPSLPAHVIQVHTIGGPHWTPGILVDVVARVEGSPIGQVLIRVPGVEIARIS